MNNWKKTTLGVVCDTISSTYKKTNEKIVLINTSDVLNGKVLNHEFVENINIKGQFKKTFIKDDILYSEIRPQNKRFAYIDFDSKNYIASTKLMVLRYKYNVLPKFLYLILSSNDVINNLQAIAETRSGTFPQITYTELSKIPINLPPLDEQKRIADVLSALDDKIEINNKINENLEAQAQAIFKRWFVDEAEENWGVVELGDVLELIESGSRPKGGIDPDLKDGIPSIGAENINGIGKYDYSKTKFVNKEFYQSINRGLIKDYDVLIYKDGAYIGRKGMFGNGFPFNTMLVNEHVFILRTNKKLNQFYLYFALEQEKLKQLNTNSAQPGLNQNSMKSLEIIIPPKNILDKFEATIKPLIDKILYNSKENKNLSEIRDSLLPKLMSGEVRV